MEKLYIGKIVGTHGLKGELKIRSVSSFSDERFKKGKNVYLIKDGDEHKMECLTHRQHKGNDLVTFKGFQDINLVERFKDYEVYGEYDQDLLDEDEYFYGDVIGCKIYDQDDQEIGVVTSIMETPRYDILVIEKNEGGRMLVPYNDAFVLKEDIYNQYIQINRIEGL